MRDCIAHKYGCSCEEGRCRLEEHDDVISPGRNWAELLILLSALAAIFFLSIWVWRTLSWLI